MGNLGAPLLGIAADQVVAFAEQFILPDHWRLGGGPHQLHPQACCGAWAVLRSRQHAVGRWPTAAVLSAVDIEDVRMLMTPGERELKNVVELCTGDLFVDEDAARVEWADAPQDDP